MSDDGAGRVWALLQLGRADDALALVRELLPQQPQDPELARLHAMALLGVGQVKAARSEAERAVGLEPDDATGHRLKGLALHGLGKCDLAHASHEEAIRLAPTWAAAHRSLADCLIGRVPPGVGRFGRGRVRRWLDEAEEHIRTAIELEPADPAGHFQEARLLLVKGQAGQARLAVERGLALDPNSAQGHYLLGVSAEVRGEVGRAADHYVEAARLDPTSRSGLDRLGNLRVAGAAGAVTIYVTIRVTVYLVRDEGSSRWVLALAGGLVFLAAVMGWLLPGWRARRALSSRAKDILERDRKLSGRRPGRLQDRLALGAGLLGLSMMLLAIFVVDDSGRGSRGLSQEQLYNLGTIFEEDLQDPGPGTQPIDDIELVPCAELPGTPVRLEGLGSASCAAVDDTVPNTEVHHCPDGRTVLVIDGPPRLRGEVGDLWRATDAPVCSAA